MRLTISFDEKDHTLYAELSSSEESEEISMIGIQQKVEEAGYYNLTIPPNAIAELRTNSRLGNECKVALKTLLDATVSVVVDSDKRKAHLTLTVADGGKPLTMELLNQAIANAGVSESLVDQDVVTNCFQRQSVKDVCIAQARLPLKGQDAEFIPLVESETQALPVVEEHGVADVKYTHQFLIVDVGTPLMRRVPSTEGEAGMDVTGAEIKPVPGNDASFPTNLSGSVISPENPNMLLAEVKGHPVVDKQGVTVDPTLHVENVDINTGHITFDGSLEVKGEVEAGMSINVTGDLVIQGGVDRANIKAGHSIKIGGGIFGEQETECTTDEPNEYCIQAGMDIEAKFVNLGTLQAGNNIIVKEYLSHSYIKAGNQLLLGQESGKGIVFGGYCEALHRVAANELGNEAYIPTRVTSGHLSELYTEYYNLEKDLATRSHEKEQLTSILQKFQQGDPVSLGKIPLDKSQKIQNTILAIKERMVKTQDMLNALEPEIELQKKAAIEVAKKIYPNTIMTINGTAKHFAEPTNGETWVQWGDALVEQGKVEQELPVTQEQKE